MRGHLTYANVCSTLALFIALGGSAYAIGSGAIGSREIRDGSIKSRDVGSNQLTAKDIEERTLRLARFYVRRFRYSVLRGESDGMNAFCRRTDSAVSGFTEVDGIQMNDPALDLSEGLNTSDGRPDVYRSFIRYAATGPVPRVDVLATVVCANVPER